MIVSKSVLDHILIDIPDHSNVKLPSGQDQHISEGYFSFSSVRDIHMKGYRFPDWHHANVLKLEEHTMFLVCRVMSVWKTAVFWVYYLGLPKEAKKFGFKLRLFNKSSENWVEVTGRVVSVDIVYQTMYYHPLGFKITFEEIKKYWKQEEIKLSWKIKVFEDTSADQKNELSLVKFP